MTTLDDVARETSLEGDRKPPARRQLVICCDGTNNTLSGGKDDTNVLQLHDHLAAQPTPAGIERILYYDPGVGSAGALPPIGPIEWVSRTWERVSGLASGDGVFENIADAYLFLMRNWRDDRDQIYLFGFSRGAFTVRAVAGMVNLFGIVRPDYAALVPLLVHTYFSPSRSSRAGTVQKAARWLHALKRHRRGPPNDDRARLVYQVVSSFAGPGRDQVWVHWVGVWDTVESVGLPGPLSLVNPGRPTVTDKRFANVRQALSLDEHRWAFSPRLYEEPDDIDRPIAASTPHGPTRQTLRQRWYPGVHCDSGGSYPLIDSGISHAALRWMVNEVASELRIEPLARTIDTPTGPVPARWWRHDALWDTPWWALAGMTLREMNPELAAHPASASGPHGTIPAGRFVAIAADDPPAAQPIHSVWEARRSIVWLLVATFGGTLCLFASGLCLMPRSEVGWTDPMTYVHAAQSVQDFADQQLEALWADGLLAPGHRPWEMTVQPGWALFWDLPFMASWAYLLARASSRAFAWLAGDRDVDSKRPLWRWLGFAPALAVGSDFGQNMSVWLALMLHGMGTDVLACVVIWLGSVCALMKFVGLAGCLPLLAVRWRIGFNPGLLWPTARSLHSPAPTVPAAPSHRHHLGDAFAAVCLSLAALGLWAFARLTLCWGPHNWFGIGSCHSHLASIGMAALAVVPLVRLARSIPAARRPPRTGVEAAVVRARDDQRIGAAGLAGSAAALMLLVGLVVLIGWVIAGTDVLF